MVALVTSVPFRHVLADPAVSQAVGLDSAVVDEFGMLLKGNDPAVSHFGLPVVEGDLVQILLATDNQVHPPLADGQPDPRNVVLSTTRVGRGTSPRSEMPATFSSLVSPRPGGNSRIFVRVFNGASLEDSSFYGDSQTFTVKSWKNEVFMGHVESTSLALDTADDDGDGLSNSWEKSYGSDKSTADSDGDGFTDGEEILAGTDLLDRGSYFNIASVESAPGGVALRWDSVPGQTYRVEHLSLEEGSSAQAVETLVASVEQTEYFVSAGFAGTSYGCYRVTVLAGNP